MICSEFIFKLNLIIIQLEYNVDQVMVPLNRVLFSATTFTFMGGLDSVLCHASCRCLQRGKVMDVRYPGPVDITLCARYFYGTLSPFGTVLP